MGKLTALFALAAFALVQMLASQALALKIQRLQPPGGADMLFRQSGMLVIRDGSGQFRRLELADGKPRLTILSKAEMTIAAAPEEAPPDALPDAVIARGDRAIRRAWLAQPTGRYDHGVLGDAVEAGALVIETASGARRQLVLAKNSVFEDRHAWIWDVDGDNEDEVVVVRSYLNAGAALAVVAQRADRLVIIAETPPIGRAHRWLNPVGIGDFDGDGKPEVAYVETPHIGGTLRIFRLSDGGFHQLHAAWGFSNHAMGSRLQGQSAVFDSDGDGIDEMLIPDAHGRALKLVGFKAGKYSERAVVDIHQGIASNFYKIPAGGSAAGPAVAVVFILRNGEVVIISR